MSNTKFKAGDRVRWVGPGEPALGVILSSKGRLVLRWTDGVTSGDISKLTPAFLADMEVLSSEDDPVSPNHYRFPGGAEVIQISEHLTSNGGQAVQYVARATRLDGQIKGNAIEDLEKSLFFIQREIDRLKESK